MGEIRGGTSNRVVRVLGVLEPRTAVFAVQQGSRPMGVGSLGHGGSILACVLSRCLSSVDGGGERVPTLKQVIMTVHAARSCGLAVVRCRLRRWYQSPQRVSCCLDALS